jgi:hypothetical protein
VAPEDPMLKRLFGVTRDDLFEMSKRQGNEPGFIPGASKNPKGSAAAESVMNPRNTQRLVDVLSEVKTNAPDLYKGMHAWYTMDPQYHRMVELMGEEKAKQMYHRLNTFGGIESPNLPVPVEFNRASAAHWLAEQGRMPDWIKYGGLRDKHLVEGMPSDIVGVPGRVGHQRASASQNKFMETGEHGMISPKAPPYIQASSVPELGFQTDLPVGDAHWSRFIGLPDVRTGKEVSASVSTPELQQLAPWWKKDVAGASDLESVPAQAIVWGAGSPQTGVKTAIGAGKLELQAIQMAEAAKRLGVSPETARDMILMGEARAGKAEGGSVMPNVSVDTRSIPNMTGMPGVGYMQTPQGAMARLQLEKELEEARIRAGVSAMGMAIPGQHGVKIMPGQLDVGANMPVGPGRLDVSANRSINPMPGKGHMQGVNARYTIPFAQGGLTSLKKKKK